MMAVRVISVERLDAERCRVEIEYQEIVIRNVVAMLSDGCVHAVHPPAIRTSDGWVPMVVWTKPLREAVRVAAENAIAREVAA